MKGMCSWLTGKAGSSTSTTNNNNTEPPSSSASRKSTDKSTTVTGDSAVAVLTPSSSHSFESPSPSPQPATPDDSTIRSNYFSDSASLKSKRPFQIATPNIRSSSGESPLFATHRASAALDISKQPPGITGFEFDLDQESDLDQDVDMTTGPGLESAFGRSRQDSFVSAGPKPISMNPNRDQGRGRRESLAGSLMNGMSWGGLSVGSFIRDE
jgi:transcription factor SFP1